MRLCGIAATGSGLFGSIAVAAPPAYIATDLSSYPGSPGNWPGFSGRGLGPGGTVVGWSGEQAVHWAPSGTSLFGGSGGQSMALAVNRHGHIVGTSRLAAGLRRAVLWAGGQVTDLGTLGGNTSSAQAINDAGAIVGLAGTPAGDTHAFLWSNGSMTGLGVLPGMEWSAAVALNDSGIVVGSSGDETRARAFRWTSSGMNDLGVPPWAPGAQRITAADVNSSGAIVGTIVDPQSPSSAGQAFLFEDGIWTELSAPGWVRTAATAINDSGIIVGYTSEPAVGFIYSDGALYDLNTLVVGGLDASIASAVDINNEGQILVLALWVGPQHSEIRHYVLTPVPAAGTSVVLGVAAVGCCRRRRGR